MVSDKFKKLIIINDIESKTFGISRKIRIKGNSGFTKELSDNLGILLNPFGIFELKLSLIDAALEGVMHLVDPFDTSPHESHPVIEIECQTRLPISNDNFLEIIEASLESAAKGENFFDTEPPPYSRLDVPASGQIVHVIPPKIAKKNFEKKLKKFGLIPKT